MNFKKIPLIEIRGPRVGRSKRENRDDSPYIISPGLYKNQWIEAANEDGSRSAYFVCPVCKKGPFIASEYRIADDGKISPKFKCSFIGCNLNGYGIDIQLKGWKEAHRED